MNLELFISAFLGFIFALLVEWIADQWRSSVNAKQLSKQLKKELQDIEDTLGQLKEDTGYLSPYSIPIWNLAIQTGQILELSKKEYYQKLIHTYGQIEEANQTETECYRILIDVDFGHLDKEAKSSIIELRSKVRSDLSCVVGDLLHAWKE